ncbi:MAG: diguanylate cyclase [Nitrosomonadales bacterium]|nr:diguanylate cyclase [Nitrosomonadales bacterium]
MNPNSQPSELARETLKTLAARKVPPTPDNYARAYQEISGQALDVGAEAVLIALAQSLLHDTPKNALIGKKLREAVKAHDWALCQSELQAWLFPAAGKGKPTLSWGELFKELLKQLETTHKGITVSRKKEGLDIVLGRFGNDPDALSEKLQGLMRSWSGNNPAEASPTEASAAPAETSPTPAAPVSNISLIEEPNHHELLVQLSELLAQTLESTQQAQPELSKEIVPLLQQVRTAHDHDQITQLAKKLRHFWIKQELHGSDRIKVQEGLVRLLRLLVENVGELVAEDKWLHGQIATFQDIITNPIDKHVIADAERSLRDAIIKQGLLQQSLIDAKTTLKTLMSSFIDRLGELTDSTGEYHNKIASYSQQIGSTDNLAELGGILEDIMRDTRLIQNRAMRSHEELVGTRKQADEAEARIRKLEQELEQVSELVREDQLTGALNRRGMDELLDREFKRADRSPSPISIALIDIDNFKRLNDSLGHQAGDQALVHLIQVTKDALRPSDAVSRYGGEEFVIILPNTGLEEAVATISRLQRELTKRFFLHNNERQLITFSAGVALRREGEDQTDVIGRADRAMYHAKQTGKNRVVAAD